MNAVLEFELVAHDIRCLRPVTDSHFNGASLIVVGSVMRVKRGFSAAMGCYARLSWYFNAGAGASKHGGAHRRTPAIVATGRDAGREVRGASLPPLELRLRSI
jgi:hypothetical protein